MKPWWFSKTIWINTIGLTALIIQGQTGFIINPAEQTAIIGVANLMLRVVSKEKITLHSE